MKYKRLLHSLTIIATLSFSLPVDAQPVLKKQTTIRLDPSSPSLKSEATQLLPGAVSVVSLQLPGSSKASDYYVRKLGNQLILNGDIVVYDYAVQSTMSYSRDDESHTFGKNDLYRWPDGTVPVVLDNSVFDKDYYNIVKAALDYFNFNTSIIFRERTNEKDYLVITCIDDDGSRRGGFTQVGRQRNGSNILRLVKGNFGQATVLHELMHTLGFFHEQGRTDRDNFVNINWNNIPENNKHDFQVEDNGTVRSPYDYCSLMQYSTMAFAVDNTQPTITCKTNSIATPCPGCMGNQSTLSTDDLDGLTRFYAEMGVSRFPCAVPFVSSKLPVAGCIGVGDVAIRNKWDFFKGVLGDCQSGVMNMGIFNSSYVQFERGIVYHTPGGVWAVYGDIYQFFMSHNGIGTFGFPVSDERNIGDEARGINSWVKFGYSRVNYFEKGVIIWGPEKKCKSLTKQEFDSGPRPLNNKTTIEKVKSPVFVRP